LTAAGEYDEGDDVDDSGETGLRHISIISVPVSDQDRAKSFYVETLGFELLADAPWGEGMRWVQVGLPGAQTSLTLITWSEMAPGSLDGILIETPDIDRTHEVLSARGVAFSGPPFDAEGGRFATFQDPDGNKMMLHAV
jgi:predicted enzyme related to lactoylglutathione lyase